jgi:hypothetical protein
MYPTYYPSPIPVDVLGSRPSQAPGHDPSRKSGSEASAMSSFTNSADAKQLVVRAEQPSRSGSTPRVSTLARRIHGWSWQAVCLRIGVCGTIIWLFIPLIVPHRHGNWCCLCHSVWLEGSSWANHEDRDSFFLHKPFTLYPQLINPPDPSLMCDSCISGSGFLSHYEYIVVYPQQSKRLINDPVKGVFVPLIVSTIATLGVSQV